MKAIYVNLLLAFTILSGQAFSADPEIYSHKKRGAINGADVVAYYSLESGEKYVKGDRSISFNYKGAIWYFSSIKNKELFMASPEKYSPQYGGYCAFAVSHNFTKPIDPNKWHIIDEKLYLNYNWLADRKWKKDISGAITRADKNWPLVLKSCEENNNCN